MNSNRKLTAKFIANREKERQEAKAKAKKSK